MRRRKISERDLNKLSIIMQKLETYIDYVTQTSHPKLLQRRALEMLGLIRRAQEIVNGRRKVNYYSLSRWFERGIEKRWNQKSWRSLKYKHRRRWIKNAPKLDEYE